MTRTIQAVATLFLALGLIGIVGTGYWALRTRSFLAEAEHVSGTVIRLELSRSNDSSAYHPVVRFRLPSGQERTFRSTSGSDPPSYAVGQAVEVLYAPSDPADARINAFFSIWGAPVIVAGMSVVFGVVGGGVLMARRAARRRSDELRRSGTPLVARFQGVERNTRFSMNGVSPWRIVTQWLDPSTGRIHLFRSEDLWFDPTPYVTRKEITVFVDRRDLRRHFVDVSFLPKLAA